MRLYHSLRPTIFSAARHLHAYAASKVALVVLRLNNPYLTPIENAVVDRADRWLSEHGQ